MRLERMRLRERKGASVYRTGYFTVITLMLYKPFVKHKCFSQVKTITVMLQIHSSRQSPANRRRQQ